jgi:hypothetical protein
LRGWNAPVAAMESDAAIGGIGPIRPTHPAVAMASRIRPQKEAGELPELAGKFEHK